VIGEDKAAVPQTERQQLAELPRQLRDLAAIVGYTNALILARHYGGVRLYVPTQMTPEHILARLLGFEKACALAREMGGLSHFDIPSAKAPVLRLLIRERDEQIRAEYAKGKSVRELALKYSVTERWILVIVKGVQAEVDASQIDLFAPPKSTAETT
jgi:hypothetical protein